MLTIKDIFTQFSQAPNLTKEELSSFEIIGGTERLSDHFLKKVEQKIEISKNNSETKLSSPQLTPEKPLEFAEKAPCDYCETVLPSKGHLILHIRRKHQQFADKAWRRRSSGIRSAYTERAKRRKQRENVSLFPTIKKRTGFINYA